ncbi:MAG: alpha-amylase family glycosyl hydrolase [Ferruginibacter sp.]
MSTEFKPLDWVKSTNIYEVNVRQYTPEGTFSAFAAHLPRLKDMGVHTLWLMPVTPIAQKNKKGSLGSPYACSSYTSINPEFGTMDDFKSLVQQSHEMGFKIIIDWVANHTGWDHEWTFSHPGYYLKDASTGEFKIASGMDDIIELDYNNPALRKAMVGAMQFWINECDIDGFRCDLASWVQLDFWLEARPVLDAVKPLFWLGEFDELDNPDYKPVFDCSYAWRWMHRTEDFYKGKINLSTLDNLLIQYDIVVENSMNLWFTSNHDENSWNGSEYEKYGNMAPALAAFSFVWNGVPLIYSGQEIPNLKRLDFFDKDAIDWNGQYALHDFYKTLISLKNNPALLAADEAVTTYRLQTGNALNVLALLRKNAANEVMSFFNWSNETVRFDFSAKIISGNYRNVFSNINMDLSDTTQFEMKPWEFLLYENKKRSESFYLFQS